MVTTNIELSQLCEKMKIPLEAILFKNNLKKIGNLKFNKSYILNLENEFDEDGEPNSGSHWVCFQVNKYENGKIAPIYFDSMGQPCPQSVIDFIGIEPPHNTKNLQSIVTGSCGYWCVSFLYFINCFPQRTGHLYADIEAYLQMFMDLNKTHDYLYNEHVLKLFFEPITV